MQTEKDIVVLGTGSLSKAFCFALASVAKEDLTLRICGRDIAQSQNIATIANCRSGLAGGRLFADAGIIEWTPEGIYCALENLKPRIIIMMSSLQSPWEAEKYPSAWTGILSKAGYGISIPVQALLASRLSRVIGNRTLKPIMINACYPDAVNPLIHAMQLPIDIGIGNVAILAAILEFGIQTPERIGKWKLLAHHVHLNNFEGNSGLFPPMAWRGEERINNIGERLFILHQLKGETLNQITGATAVPMILSLLRGETTIVNVPGPKGLPGGYPVELSKKGVKILDLPSMDIEQMTKWNQIAAEADGVQVLGNRVDFKGRAHEILKRYAPSLASGFKVDDLEDFTIEFIKFQNKERKK